MNQFRKLTHQNIITSRSFVHFSSYFSWIILVAFIFRMGDLNQSYQPTIHEIDRTTILPEVDEFWNDYDLPEEKISPRALQTNYQDNRANKFANVLFILNPTYAKRKGVDPRLVVSKLNILNKYIYRFRTTAESEMKRYGIPASITLAQAILESDAGGSRLSRAANNHFGIKCFSRKCTKNHCKNFSDDTHKDFFRNYSTAWESFRAHSKLLMTKRYRHLKKFGTKDYKAWAHGLKKAGYATDPKYAEKLILIIEELDLHQYDR